MNKHSRRAIGLLLSLVSAGVAADLPLRYELEPRNRDVEYRLTLCRAPVFNLMADASGEVYSSEIRLASNVYRTNREKTTAQRSLREAQDRVNSGLVDQIYRDELLRSQNRLKEVEQEIADIGKSEDRLAELKSQLSLLRADQLTLDNVTLEYGYAWTACHRDATRGPQCRTELAPKFNALVEQNVSLIERYAPRLQRLGLSDYLPRIAHCRQALAQ